MEDELNLNTKLFAFNGVIGRRDYIINVFIITMISQLFTSPLFFGKMHSLDFNNSFFAQLTDIQKILLSISTLICLPLGFSNMARRLSDIWNKKADFQIYFILVIFSLFSFSLSFYSFKSTWMFYFITSVFSFFLMAKKGEVTGKYPIDKVKKFNWGAYFGTWIWGLFNKTFITLWEIPLLLTPVGQFTFPLICGLKGNEWAYKNKQYPDIETFHKSQRKQARIFSTIIIVGSLLITVLFATISTKMLSSYLSKKENRIKYEQKLDSILQEKTKRYFTKIEVTKNENKVYMNPIVWKNMDINEKMDTYRLAYTCIASEKQKTRTKFNFQEEREKTTIYSNYNGEVLAKFDSETKTKDSGFIKAMRKALTENHFNYNPQIPSGK